MTDTHALQALRDKVADGGLVSIPYDGYGPVRIVAQADGYVMVRRPQCAPFVKTRKEILAILDALIYEASGTSDKA